MITLRIRWRMIFEPVCWVRAHNVKTILGGSPLDLDEYYCQRCDRRRRSWKIVNEIRKTYSHRYLVSLDWDGNEIGRSLQASNDPNADFS